MRKKTHQHHSSHTTDQPTQGQSLTYVTCGCGIMEKTKFIVLAGFMYGHISNKSVTLNEITIMNSLAFSTKSFKI